LKVSNKNILLSELRWNNNTKFIHKVHDFGASGPGVKPGIFPEDVSRPCFHVILCSGTSRYAHQVIYKCDKDDLSYSLKSWTDTIRSELYTIIALVMLMARNWYNSLKEYWLERCITEL
jgi:hypothetical protein